MDFLQGLPPLLGAVIGVVAMLVYALFTERGFELLSKVIVEPYLNFLKPLQPVILYGLNYLIASLFTPDFVSFLGGAVNSAPIANSEVWSINLLWFLATIVHAVLGKRLSQLTSS